MRYVAAFCMAIIISTISAAYGGNKKSAGEADILAGELMSKMVFYSVQARAEGCRLRINFQSPNAAFDLPLEGTTVRQSSQDSILVTNRNMTRALREQAPEPFDQLTLRFHQSTVQQMLKVFNDAIAACRGTTTGN